MGLHVEPAHAGLWTALAALASAAAGYLRKHTRRSRKLERDVAVLKMQLAIHQQILAAHGFMAPPSEAPRSDL